MTCKDGTGCRYGLNLSTIQANEITQVAHMENSDIFDKIVVVGLSIGVSSAVNQIIINDDIDAVVLASGMSSLANSPFTHQTPRSSGMLLCCDRIDKVATIAPKPMYVSYGTVRGWSHEI